LHQMLLKIFVPLNVLKVVELIFHLA